MKCPICDNDVAFTHIGIRSKDEDLCLDVGLKAGNDIGALLYHALVGYWRWVAEGKVEYGPGRQYYYDPYHNGITYNGKDGYSYSIQISDSPEGDTWLKGTFMVRGMVIESVTKGSVTL